MATKRRDVEWASQACFPDQDQDSKAAELEIVKARGDIYRSSLLFEQVEHVDGLLEFAILDKREDN